MKISERYPRETGREYALRTIKENLINLELAPGSQISENELAEAMGISRTPVREALIELAKVKVIEIVPQKRSLVTPLNEELIEEARFLRSAMETAVVKLVCEKRTEEDLRAFEENVKLQSFCLANGMSEKMMQLDDEFHRAFYEIAHKMEIYRLMQNMAIHFDRVRNMALYSVSEIKIVHDHEAILEAIREQNGEKAGSLLQKHLSRYKIDADAIKERFPDFF
jgi:DNA-binding GntR family transcriptional regulator